MGLPFGNSRAAIATPGKKNVQAAPTVPLQLVSMPVSELPGDLALSKSKRVKVFRLNDGGRWDDCGTGHVTIDHLPGRASRRRTVLAVIDEENADPMLLHLITPDDIYRKQEDIFITWCDPEAGMTLCLSFQDGTRCSSIWNEICQVQRKQSPDHWSAIDTSGRLDVRSASDTNAPQG